VIPLDLAEQLALAGLVWTPTRGDVFVLPHRDMDEQVFVLSDMTIEVHRFPAGEVIGFNGTVEWALDSVERHEALWLPREDQLRDLLGDAFVALHRQGEGFRCQVRDGADAVGSTAAEAYGRALLADLLGRVAVPPH
jgi:hypothetical protein